MRGLRWPGRTGGPRQARAYGHGTQTASGTPSTAQHSSVGTPPQSNQPQEHSPAAAARSAAQGTAATSGGSASGEPSPWRRSKRRAPAAPCELLSPPPAQGPGAAPQAAAPGRMPPASAPESCAGEGAGEARAVRVSSSFGALAVRAAGQLSLLGSRQQSCHMLLSPSAPYVTGWAANGQQDS